jgi:glycosyltransferase involved in cell wall biosynthesis
LKYYYILHSPASLIPDRYKYIAKNIKKFRYIKGIAVSEFVKKEATPYFLGMPVEVIKHGINIQNFKLFAKYIDKPKLKIVTVASLDKWKGIQDVIKAISSNGLNNDFDFHIYGLGPYKDELIKLIYRYNLNERVIINSPVENVEDVLPNYDIYCQMSIGEAFGLSLFEAMACGIPTIVYDTPPFDILLNKQIAKKVKVKSISDLRNALVGYKDYNERYRYGMAGKNFVKKYFSVKKMAKEYFDLLSALE